MIIDVHTHIFPDNIAEKAARAISRFYELDMDCDGKVGSLLRETARARVDHVVVCSAATTPTQTCHINDFVAETVARYPHIMTGLGAMHQDFADKPAELLRMRALGLQGVKIHPDIQGVAINDRRFDALYEAMQACGMPLLAHTGDIRYHNSNPPELTDMLDRFPRLTVVCAHLGSWSNWTQGVEYLAGRDNVFVDTSSSLYALSPADALRVVRAYGSSRVLFGSDFPMWNATEELERLDRLRLTGTELDDILYKNAKALFHIA